MSLINDTLKNITLKELCLLIVLLYIVYYALNSLDILHFNSIWIYVFIIIYFMFKLRNSLSSLKTDIKKVFSGNLIGYVLLIVFLNIFFSYGMLYLSDFILDMFPDLNFFVEFPISSLYLNNSATLFSGFIATVLISPVSEELIFRGALLNRLRIFIPSTVALIITSLLFASLHSFGSLTSAFVFAMCMGILYIKTENIFVPIFAHFLNNFLAECIVAFDSQNLLFTDTAIMMIMSVLAVVSLIFILYSILKEWNNIK